MYNDYYLQQIDNKLSTTNNNLDSIVENQQKIIENQIYIISGDSIFHQKHDIYFNNWTIVIVGILFSVILSFVCELVEHFIGIKRG